MSKKEEINFEDSMKKLEQIATDLETGKLSLDESLKKFEEGMSLSKQCNDILNNAEKRISVLINDDGEIKEKNFEINNNKE